MKELLTPLHNPRDSSLDRSCLHSLLQRMPGMGSATSQLRHSPAQIASSKLKQCLPFFLQSCPAATSFLLNAQKTTHWCTWRDMPADARHVHLHADQHTHIPRTRQNICTNTQPHTHLHTYTGAQTLLPPAEHTGKHTPAHACAAPTLSRPHAGVSRFTCLLLASLASLPPRATDGNLHLHPSSLSFLLFSYNSYSLQVSQPIRRKSSSNSGLTFTLQFRIRTTSHDAELVKCRNTQLTFQYLQQYRKVGICLILHGDIGFKPFSPALGFAESHAPRASSPTDTWRISGGLLFSQSSCRASWGAAPLRFTDIQNLAI